MTPFVHLHVHSQYSILDGQASVKGLVDKAIANGMRGMALTDHGNMFGIKELHDYVAKKNGVVNGRIKDLKKQIKADEGEGTDTSSLLEELRAEEAKLFKPIFGCEVYVANQSRQQKNTCPLRAGQKDGRGIFKDPRDKGD